MGHWEQIAEHNRRARAAGQQKTGWQTVALYAALISATAFLWFIMLWPAMSALASFFWRPE